MSSSSRKENCGFCHGGDWKLRKPAASSGASCSGGGDSDIDMVCLNNALHELGMLSAITESRKQYLQENASRKAAPPRAIHRDSAASPGGCVGKGFCVLRMNSDYVTDFSGLWKCGKSAAAAPSIELASDAHSRFNVLSAIRKDDGGCCYGRAKSKLNRFRVHVQKPYNGPWMQRWESHEWFPHAAAQNDPPILPKEASANRSNPGSPEKGPLESSGCSLARSRSLDDIESLPGSGTNAEALPIVTGQRSEIERMSQKLESLHVI